MVVRKKILWLSEKRSYGCPEKILWLSEKTSYGCLKKKLMVVRKKILWLSEKKGYKFISSRKQEKCTKANCMTTEAHFLEKMKKLDFKQCAERQYQQTLVAKNLC